MTGYCVCMTLAQWARSHAEGLLAPLGARWAHVQPAAEQARFLGSPTIRVDGRDIEPGAERQEESVHACRLSGVGRNLRGLPDEDWLGQALLTPEARS
jgi:hypothetical protein